MRATTHSTRPAVLVFVAIMVMAPVFLAGCTGTSPTGTTAPSPIISPSPGQTPSTPAQKPGFMWKMTQLSDLRGRGTFSIGGFPERIVIVTVQSVSCPSCIARLKSQIDEAGLLAARDPGVIVIALDTDPADGPDFISAYGNPAAFTGYSARVPERMTADLYNYFGPFAVDPTTTPVILVCPGGSDKLLPPGLKTADDLAGIITREC